MPDLDELHFRRASAAHAQPIAALHAESWRRHYRGAYSDSFLNGDLDDDRLAVWTARLARLDGTTATIVAEERGQLVGFVHVAFDDDPTWGSLVDNLHVIHFRKRAGIGKRLMSEAAAAVLGHGPGGLFLWVLEQNLAAQAFYHALGGQRVERAMAAAPRGDPSFLNGQPTKLRYTWGDPSVLARP